MMSFISILKNLHKGKKKFILKISFPRKVERQKHRSNYSTDDPEHFFFN